MIYRTQLGGEGSGLQGLRSARGSSAPRCSQAVHRRNEVCFRVCTTSVTTSDTRIRGLQFPLKYRIGRRSRAFAVARSSIWCGLWARSRVLITRLKTSRYRVPCTTSCWMRLGGGRARRPCDRLGERWRPLESACRWMTDVHGCWCLTWRNSSVSLRLARCSRSSTGHIHWNRLSRLIGTSTRDTSGGMCS